MRYLRPVLLIGILVVLGITAYPQTAKSPVSQIITKQALEKRITELQKGRDEAIANANAYTGAIQECQYWLDWIDKASKPASEPKK